MNVRYPLLLSLFVLGTVGCRRAVPSTLDESAAAPPIEVEAIPAGTIPVQAVVARTWEQQLGAVFSPVPESLLPVAEELRLPELDGAHAIWGAVGRDDRGHIWFGVHSQGPKSAFLVEFDPLAGEFHNRGDVNAQLAARGLLLDGETQEKIHCKPAQADDGFLYFCSMDETDEEEDGSRYARWGGHLWRIHLATGEWQHLLRTKEPLIALAVCGRWVYAEGYFNQVIFRYDTQTGDIARKELGSLGGHVSRNIFCDARGHVYAPRLARVERDGAETRVASLIELDPQLEIVAETPLEHYGTSPDFDSEGITGFTFLRDGRPVFLTDVGHLYVVQPPADEGPANVESLGWLSPDGPSIATSIFAVDGETVLIGQARRPNVQPRDLYAFDLRDRTSRKLGILPGTESITRSLHLYGSHTRDDSGALYFVGRLRAAEGTRPFILRARFEE